MCPSCEKGTLHPTGAFWVCEVCGLVITQQALTFAQRYQPASEEVPEMKDRDKDKRA